MNFPFTSNWLVIRRLFPSTLTYKKGGQMTSQLEVKGEFI